MVNSSVLARTAWLRPRWWCLGLLAGLAYSSIGVCAASGTTQDATLPLKERVRIAVQARSDIEQYFAHWQGTGNLDFDAEYAKYLDEITRTNDRRSGVP